jgi:riboflavin kinase/FMN adenylyltransferase
MSEKLGFEVIVGDWIKPANDMMSRTSSTRVRELVIEGSVEDAQHLLGRQYQIRGVVEQGRDRGGKLLGFPTANIKLHDELCPKTGVYAVTVDLDGKLFPGVANIGYSPTFDDHLFTVEVHILDFGTDIYGKKIKVNFVRRIRDEMKFSSIDELAKQIEDDIRLARKMISI